MTFRTIIILLIIIISSSCKRDDDGYIPLVPVDIYLYTSDPEYFDLNVTGGWTYVMGGSRGILVYRQAQGDFLAYDRHCTYQPSNSCGQVAVNTTNIMAVDSCCGSQFLITDGSVAKGPATRSLKQYQTSFDGTVLHITN